jgi:hypothetical protein
MTQPPYGPPPQGTPIVGPPPQGSDPYGPPPQGAALLQPGPQSSFSPPPVVPASGMGALPAKAPLYKRSWFIVVVVIAALTVIGSALSKKDETDTTPAPVAATSPSQQVETPAPSTPAAPPVVPTPAAVVPTQAPQAAAVNFAMPDFVGMDLQSAQNLVQTNGVFFSQSHDLLGSRTQLVDSNWLVCDQNIPAGQQVTGEAEGLIDFGVVKRGEACP